MNRAQTCSGLISRIIMAPARANILLRAIQRVRVFFMYELPMDDIATKTIWNPVPIIWTSNVSKVEKPKPSTIMDAN